MKSVEKVLQFCETKYPEHEPIIVENGEIIIIYLRHPQSNWQNKDLTVYYNIWYADEFNISKFTSIDE